LDILFNSFNNPDFNFSPIKIFDFYSKFKALVVVFLIGSFSMLLPLDLTAQNISIEKKEWSNPDLIDPFEAGIDSFLDVKLGSISRLADEAYRKKDYVTAAKYYLFILKHNYDDERTLYNLACCYALLEKPKLAAANLIRAVNAGFTNFEHIKKDNDFNKIKDNKYFQRALKNIEDYKKNIGEPVYIKATKLIKCNVHLPKNFDPDKNYTLLIGLHGNGGDANSFSTLWLYFENPDFIFAAPEGTYLRRPDVGVKTNQYSWEIQIHDTELWKRSDPLTMEYIVETAKYLSSIYKVDKVYLIGFSQGAAYAYISGIKNTNIFNGIMCFGGRFPEMGKSWSILSEGEVKNSKNLRVFIAHGTEDGALDFDNAVQTKTMLEKYNYNATFTGFKGGHFIPPNILNKAIKWMMQK